MTGRQAGETTVETRSAETIRLADIARRVLPGGHFGNFTAEPIIREGRGGRVWDEDGREYVDYLLGSGPMLVGHAHPDVTAAVQRQILRGTTFFANSAPGILLAEAIVDAVPCAEQVRFVSSGSEADAYAMRLARAFRKRDKILKFEGGYHGMSDYGLMSLAPKQVANFPTAVPDSPGIPASVRQEMLVAPFNDLETAVAMLREHADEIGGVIVEPCQRLLPPAPGFLEGLRRITTELGIPLIFDEVVTGIPLRLRRGAGVLRRRSGHLHARQGLWRWLPAGGDRRADRVHGAVRPGGRGRGAVPDADRHTVRQPRRIGGGPGHHGAAARARQLRAALRDRAGN